MKKAILAVMVLASMYSCSNQASITGKWRAVDMKMDGKNDAAMQQKVKEELAKENMVFEFGADGTFKISGKTLPASNGKYIKNGETIITTGSDSKVDTLQVAKLADKTMDLRNNSEKMTVVLEKM